MKMAYILNHTRKLLDERRKPDSKKSTQALVRKPRLHSHTPTRSKS